MKTLVFVAALALALGPTGGFAHEEGPGGKAAGASRGHESEGHGAEFGSPGDPKKVSRTIAVGMGDDMRFKPSRITVRKGETVKFVVRNNGRLKHEMVLGSMKELREHAKLMRKFPEMEHQDPNAVSVEPGETGTLIWHFTKAGRSDFGCLLPGHFEAGMVGKIAVNP